MSDPAGRLQRVLDAWDAAPAQPGDPHLVIAAIPDPGPGGPHAKLTADDLRALLWDNRTLAAKLAAAGRAAAAGCVPGSTDELLGEAVLARHPDHAYVSTACHHALHPGAEHLHQRCRQTCKFCLSPCTCSCHTAGHAPAAADDPAPLGGPR